MPSSRWDPAQRWCWAERDMRMHVDYYLIRSSDNLSSSPRLKLRCPPPPSPFLGNHRWLASMCHRETNHFVYKLHTSIPWCERKWDGNSKGRVDMLSTKGCWPMQREAESVGSIHFSLHGQLMAFPYLLSRYHLIYPLPSHILSRLISQSACSICSIPYPNE